MGDPPAVRRKRWTPAAPDRQSLTERLFYEVQMTFFLAGQLQAQAGSRVDLSLRNAQIEALALHLRQLVDFFWGERPRSGTERDAFAADYFREGDWGRIRPQRPAILEKALVGSTRLSYDEAWARPVDEVWDVVSQVFALAPVVKRFADAVDHSQFVAGYVHGMRICAEEFVSGQRGPAAGSSLAA